jgi:sulfur carrier protein
MTAIGPALNIYINDQARTVAVETSIPDLLTALGMVGRQGLAVAVNSTVVPRCDWSTRNLREGDSVLIIQASQGG